MLTFTIYFLFHFGFTVLTFACDFTVFRDVILAQESEKEEMLSKYFTYTSTGEIFTIWHNPLCLCLLLNN